MKPEFLTDGLLSFLHCCEHEVIDFKAFEGICERLYIGHKMYYYLSQIRINENTVDL